MALDRKDVRCKLDPDDHEQLKIVCEFDGMEMGEWVERVILDEIHRRTEQAAEAQALHERLSKQNVSGRTREQQGTSGTASLPSARVRMGRR